MVAVIVVPMGGQRFWGIQDSRVTSRVVVEVKVILEVMVMLPSKVVCSTWSLISVPAATVNSSVLRLSPIVRRVSPF